MPLDTALVAWREIVLVGTAGFELLAGTDLLLRTFYKLLRGLLGNGLQRRIL